MAKEYEHAPVGEEIEAIGGRYTILKEESLPFNGAEVLYLVGAGVFDTSCCGAGGCGYAVVPGSLIKRDIGRTAAGQTVSLVEPIADEQQRREIEAALKEKEKVSQVNFL